MEKKLWSNAEVVELGVESTREEQLNENAKIVGKCRYCSKVLFWWDIKDHESVCEKNPKFEIMDDMTTNYPVPTFS